MNAFKVAVAGLATATALSGCQSTVSGTHQIDTYPNTITVDREPEVTTVAAPNLGIAGRICVLSELNAAAANYSPEQITQAHRDSTAAVDAVIEENLGTVKWSGKSAAQARGVEDMVNNAIPGAVDEMHFGGDRSYGMAECNGKAQALATKEGQPVHAIGMFGPAGGVIRQDQIEEYQATYPDVVVGQRFPFRTTGGQIFQP